MTFLVATDPKHFPKIEITERHIPNQPWNDHTNYFAVLEDDDDNTVAASNMSEGYFDEDNHIGMENVPPTTQHQKPVQMLNMTTPMRFPKSEKPEQVNKMGTPFFLQNS